jgi:hypothetical protein
MKNGPRNSWFRRTAGFAVEDTPPNPDQTAAAPIAIAVSAATNCLERPGIAQSTEAKFSVALSSPLQILRRR